MASRRRSGPRTRSASSAATAALLFAAADAFVGRPPHPPLAAAACRAHFTARTSAAADADGDAPPPPGKRASVRRSFEDAAAEFAEGVGVAAVDFGGALIPEDSRMETSAQDGWWARMDAPRDAYSYDDGYDEYDEDDAYAYDDDEDVSPADRVRRTNYYDEEEEEDEGEEDGGVDARGAPPPRPPSRPRPRRSRSRRARRPHLLDRSRSEFDMDVAALPRLLLSERFRISFTTLGRVLLPSLLANLLGIAYYDNLSLYISANLLDPSSIKFLSSDELQFIPSFLTVISLLFSILAGNAFSSLYQQQETIYFALYREVSEAKSLLEQMTLVCSGRPFYRDALRMLETYIRNDLRRVDVPPAELIARSPRQDPLEAIMYLTSVGVPSVIYETVRDLRQARGYRLGAMQRKFPRLGIVLLWLLAILELGCFPLLGAGSAAVATFPESILLVQAVLFGGLCGATTLVLRIIQELWRTSGGSFNVDPILNKMCQGLTEELDARANGLPTQGAGTSGGGGRRANRARRGPRAALDARDHSPPIQRRVPRADARPEDGDGGTDRAMRTLLARVEELEERLADAEAPRGNDRQDGDVDVARAWDASLFLPPGYDGDGGGPARDGSVRSAWKKWRSKRERRRDDARRRA